MRLQWSIGTGWRLPWRRDMIGALQRAALRATDRASVNTQESLRNAMRSQRLGNLGNAVRQTSDAKRRRIHRRGDLGFSASGIVYVGTKNDRTTGALQAYLEGPVNITPTSGRRWLAIATNAIPRKAGRFRMTPQRYKEGGFESKIGPLVFVKTSKANVAYLIAKDVSIQPKRSGSARRLPKSGRPRAGRAHVGIVAFVLIRATRRDKRIDVTAIAQREQGQLLSYLAREFDTNGRRSQPTAGYGFSL